MTRAERGFGDLMMLAIIAGAVIAAAAAWWLHADRAEQFKAGQDATQQLWDADTTKRLAIAVEDARLAAAETQRRLTAQQENQRAQDNLLAQARRDAAAASAAVDGLRLRASAYLSAAGCSAATGDSAIECIRAAAGQIGDVLGQCAARHQLLAADADDARARGLKCEKDYDALSVAPN